LPWRSAAARRDPYRVWLAEVMLQQTRVAAAVPYYQRFLRRFPTVRALARAQESEVLRHWAGLGYYSRARNLHRAAREIVRRHAGRFPREYDAALSLPGVGRYTAAAVLSIAYGAPYAVLDGNVARVLARLDGAGGDLRAPRRWRALEDRAQQLLDPRAPGDWNQAMMELGATVCTPRAPRCAACPVRRWCRAYALGLTEEIPAKRRKRAPVRLRIAAAVLLDRRGRTLLLRPSRRGDVFSGMWHFPAVRVARDARRELLRHLRGNVLAQRKQRRRGHREGPRPGASIFALERVEHSVTFREISFEPFLFRVRHLPPADGSARVLPLDRLDRLPVSGATRKIARAALPFA
jgi:A/G-specific adenine glycosylase